MNSSAKILGSIRALAPLGSLLLFCAGNAPAQSTGIPVPAGTWTMPLTRGLPAASNGWEQLVYVPELKESVMLSIYRQRSSEPNESFVGYNFDTNSWDIIDMGGLFHTESIGEGGETQGYFDYNPNNNTIIYHCCTTGSNQPENAFHTWWYDVVGQSGLDKNTTLKPPATSLQPGGAFDVAHDTFVVHGGDSFVGTWTYSPANNTWQHVTTNGTPPDPSLILPGMAYNSVAQRVYLFGGVTAAGYNSNLYSYDVPTSTWTLITPNGGITPSGRNRFGFAYDSTNHVFLLYGGQNSLGVLGDTWVFNPATNTWTQLTPAQSPPMIAGAPVWARLAYDSDHNAFVLAAPGTGGYFGGNWTSLAIQTWLFRYQGVGPNAGTMSSAAQAADGSINRNTTSWAKDPMLAASGSALYVAWSETGPPFDSTNAAWPHIYVSQYSAGNWNPVGTSFSALSTDIKEAHLPAIALIGGAPWVSWYEGSNQPGQTPAISAKTWNGSSWTGGAIGLVGTTAFQGRSQMTGIGSVPYLAFTEVNKTFYPQQTFAYVKTWNGTSWPLLGGALNRNTGTGTTADSISITNNGTNPWVAWTEYAHSYGSGGSTDTNPQVYVSYWNGTQWVAVGGSLNVSSSNWAYDAAIAFLGTQPYVAWTERSTTGTPQLYLKTWNGTSWILVGSGSLNQNSATGWALRPSLIADPGTNSLYLGWVEQSALGQKAKAYVGKYNAGTWTVLGGALNADSVKGSAQRVTVGVYNGQSVAAWGEVNPGWLRQIYVAQWSGSSWTQLSGTGGPLDTTAPTTPANLAAAAISANQINLAWTGSIDAVGISGYRIFRGGSQIGLSTEAITYQDTTVSPNTTYSYKVAAYDAAGNVSAQSVAASATTPPASSPPPTVSVTAPVNGATLSGTVTVSANATSTVGMSRVQFQIDGVNLGAAVMGAGPSYSTSWNTTSASNTIHTVSAVAIDTLGYSSSNSVSVTVNNPVAPPVISAVAAGPISSSGATITWTTDQASDSQVAYGTTVAYGSTSPLNSALVTAHSINLIGLAPSTTYHFQVLSRNAGGALAASGDFMFTTTAPPPFILQIHGDASEVSGVTNGSIVTPSTAPAGFTGTVVVNGAGSVNFAPVQTGNGVYFLNCCTNANNAYYKFTGATIGNIFNTNQGQITFYLRSRYSFAQRQASAALQRYAFDVRDGSNNHLFYFLTQISSGYLQFTYAAGGAAQFYFVPKGTEDALFGSGVMMQVTLAWNSGVVTLSLNGTPVRSSSYTPSTPSWTAASNFNLGAYEYLTYGGYDSSDDIIDEFSVPAASNLAPPTVSVTAPVNGATLSGTVSVSANATSTVGMSRVQFQIDGVNLGAAVMGAGPSYSTSWNTTTAGNTTHTVSAVAIDTVGNNSTNSVSVTVNNPVAPPVISMVAAGPISSSGATITWTTDQASDSQVAYGTTIAYGSASTLNSAPVTSHSVNLIGLAASTTYHFQVLSRNAGGALATSGDFMFTTTAPSPFILQIHGDASEVSGVTNGSIVTPSTAPAGFTGTVVVNGAGSVNFAPVQTGNGVYFLNCCTNANNAYYKFTGATIGNIFNTTQGQITFYLKSRYSFAQRQASAVLPRYAFDVRDGGNNHLFYFLTQISSGYLQFTYAAGGAAQFYFVPKGTEDALFGSGVMMQVTLAWNSGVVTLSLNGAPVRSSSYTPVTPNWTAASNFDFGGYEYLTFGGYDVSDDVINQLTCR